MFPIPWSLNTLLILVLLRSLRNSRLDILCLGIPMGLEIFKTHIRCLMVEWHDSYDLLWLFAFFLFARSLVPLDCMSVLGPNRAYLPAFVALTAAISTWWDGFSFVNMAGLLNRP